MSDNVKIVYASAKPTEELFALFDHVQRLDVNGLGKAEILERAERYLVSNKERINFKSLSKSRIKMSYVGELPSSFKVRINDEDLDANVNEILKAEYKINRIMTPFKLRIVLSAYILHLENDFEESCGENEESIDSIKLKAISLILRENNNELIESVILSLGGEM